MAKKNQEAAAETTSVVKYDEIFAAEAKKYANAEKLGSGQFISLKAGVMTFNSEPLQGNCLGCVILDSVHTNIWYEGDYDAETPQSPACYSIGREEASLSPHEESENPQCESCESCEKNQWGSAERGKGKACQNTRRLAIISAGTFDKKTKEFSVYEDAADFKDAEPVFLKLPVTSVKAYSAFVHELASAIGRPPWGVVTRIGVVPDAKTQFKLTFELIETVADDVLAAVKARHDSAMEAIMFGFPKFNEQEKQPAKKQPAKKKY